MATPRPAKVTEVQGTMLAHLLARETDPAGRWDASADWVWGGVWTRAPHIAALRSLRAKGLLELGSRLRAGRDVLVRLTPRGVLTAIHLQVR